MFDKDLIKIMKGVIGCDSETRLMCEKYGSTPPPICFTYAHLKGDATFSTSLIAKASTDISMKDSFRHMIRTADKLIFHNAGFDLTVALNEWPEMASDIFKALDEGRIHCTAIREKFLNLAEFGAVKETYSDYGQKIQFKYSLDTLVLNYLNKDISEDKHASDSWRTNYESLEDTPGNEWPKEAIKYAEMDAVYVVPIYAYQERRAKELEKLNGVNPFSAEKVRTQIAFAMAIMGNVGMYVDTDKSVLLDEFLTQDLSPERLNAMFDAEKGIVDLKILKPEVPPQPYAKKTLDHQPECVGHKENPAYKKGKRVTDCGCPVKMKKAVAEKIDKKKLKVFMQELAEKDPSIEIRRTEPSDRMPEGDIKTDQAWFNDFGHLHPIFQQYQYREKEGKIRRDYIKKLFHEDGTPVTIIRACFDILKRSGRVSSYGGNLYPSWNCQNVDPRIRTVCYAPGGWLFLSSDYNAMELGTAAQTCINTVGYSVMADVINSGKDVHAYLGGRIAYETDDQFRQYCRDMGVSKQEGIYDLFMTLKGSDDLDLKKFFKKYRTLAKPTGLGYPGGLGPQTFVVYAKQTFGVIVTEKEAENLRTIWRELFPEFPEYHKYITHNCEDLRLGPVMVPDKRHPGRQREQKKFKYITPMGMMRPGCDFTKVANGMCMQSPSSEGSLIGGYEIARECLDKTCNSPLYGNLVPIAPIHDEYMSYLREFDGMQEVIDRKEKIMIDNMQKITPDVKAGVESVLTRRWYKQADPVFDDKGNLAVWEPSEDDEIWLDEKVKRMKEINNV